MVRRVMVKTATDQQILNALKSAHTDIHRALHEIEHDGSKLQAKASLAKALKAIANAFLLL